MKWIKIVSLLALTTCVSTSVKRETASTAASLDYPQFLNLLKSTRAATIADALKELRAKHEDYLRFRTAMYESESIQEATFTEPRVIVFGPEAKFVFTFNGGKHRYGGDAIEAYQFDDRTQKFSFFSILFKRELIANVFEDDEIAFENSELIVSKANPKLCLGCHGENHPNPIWSSDLNWAGAFGSNDDLLFGSFHKTNYTGHGKYQYLQNLAYPRSQGRWIDIPPGVRDVELAGYMAYLAGAQRHPRYQHLPPQIFEAGFRKFASGASIESLDESAAIETEAKRLGQGPDGDRPNSLMTKSLMTLAMASLIADIERTPGMLDRLRAVIKVPYGVYYGAGRNGLVDADEHILDASDPAIVARLQRQQGPFSKHFQRILREEFEMQDVRLARIEQDLKTRVTVPVGWPGDGQPYPPTVGDYQRLLGRKLTRRELINVQSEAAGLPALAQISYVLKSGGIEMKDYDTNSHLYPKEGRKRVLSIYHGLEALMSYILPGGK